MQKQIYCKTVAQDKIAFYVQSAGKEFMLFTQRYYPSVWRYFAGGVDIHKVFDFNGRNNHAIQAVKQKLPAYIRYVENEYDVQLLSKTLKKLDGKEYRAKKGAYKRKRYDYRMEYDEEIA